MKNRDIEAAWNYHNGTKHSYQSIRANRHYLDWENQPMPFKIYSNLEPIALPQHLSSSGMPALMAVSASGAAVDDPTTLSSQTLAEVLFLSAGITRRRPYSGGEILFRAAACTGALYHIDLYVVCGDLEGLKQGSISSARKISPCAGCAREITVQSSSVRPAKSRQSPPRRA